MISTQTGTLAISGENSARLWHDRGEPVGVLVEEGTTNLVADNTASTSSGSTLPTGASFWAAGTSITASVTGHGKENGIDYYDVLFQGRNATGSPQFLDFVPAQRGDLGLFNKGDAVVFSGYFRPVAGNIDQPNGYTMVHLRINVFSSADAWLSTLPQNQRITDNGELIREWAVGVCPADNRRLEPHIGLTAPNGLIVDFTLRLGLMQIEHKVRPTTPVRTTGTAATRAAETMTALLPNGTHTVYVERVGHDRQIVLDTYAGQSVSATTWQVPASPHPFVWRISITPLREAYPSLGSLASKINVRFGASFMYWHHHINDAPYRAILQQQLNIYGAEFELKWWMLQPRDGVFDSVDADAFVGAAGRDGKAMRGHTMLWHVQLPTWLVNKLNSANWRSEVDKHFARVCNRWPSLTSWDVVNEAIDDDGSYRNSIWYRAAGTEYVDFAFQTCAQYAPNIPRYYCDYGLEEATPWAANKRAAVLAMLTRLVRAGVPVSGLNLQGHLQLDHPYDSQVLRRFIQQVKDLGLKVISTEIDVSGPSSPVGAEQYDARAADLVRRYLDDLLVEGAGEIKFWGFSDKYTWLNDYFTQRGPHRALPYDSSFKPKHIQASIRQALMRRQR